MQGTITPNLWFDTQAEEAAAFYLSVFPNSRILNVTHYTEAGPREAGMVLTVEFELNGQRFVGINGGPNFTFDEAISFEIDCETQEELDYYWERAHRRRRGEPVRLAEGPLRRLVAGRADRHGRALRRSGSRSARGGRWRRC